jgi:hypothetical protein
LAQSIPRPVAGTLYAPVYVKATGEFVGWEGSDKTFVTPQGQFFPSVEYDGVSVVKLASIYIIGFNIETFEILYFKVGSVQYSVDGAGLRAYSVGETYDSGTPYYFESSGEEDYPMPPSGKDEGGRFTQRIFFKALSGRKICI